MLKTMNRSIKNQGMASKLLICAVTLWGATAHASMNLVLSLDGNGSYVSVPSSASLQNPDEITIETWISPARSAGWLLAKSDGANGGSQRTYEVKLGENGIVTFAAYFTLPVGANQPDYAEIS